MIVAARAATAVRQARGVSGVRPLALSPKDNEIFAMDDFTATASAPLTNSIGLHARPSVKLTKLAKKFESDIEVAATENGPWVDAKSIVKVMAVKAARGTTLHFRARGPDATMALGALHDLIAMNFHDDEPAQAEGAPETPNG